MAREDEIGKPFHFSDVIEFPLDLVWPVYRNEMPNLTEHLPNINKILVRHREDIPGGVRVELQWFARARLPGMAARLIPPEKLMWIDSATWNDAEHHVDYELTLPELADAVRVAGRNSFVADGRRTRLTLDGALYTDIAKIKTVPRALLKVIVPAVEAFAVQLTKPNFLELNRGVESYLRTKG